MNIFLEQEALWGEFRDWARAKDEEYVREHGDIEQQRAKARERWIAMTERQRRAPNEGLQLVDGNWTISTSRRNTVGVDSFPE